MGGIGFNLLRELRVEGSWLYDRKRKMLYWILRVD